MGLSKSQRPVWLGVDNRGWDHVRVHIQLLDDDRLGPYELAVYLGIARHAEVASGDAHPSVATLARYGGMSERRAGQALESLTEWGYIEVHPTKGRASRLVLLPPPTPAPRAEHPRTTCRGTSAPGADEQEPPNETLDDSAVAAATPRQRRNAEAKEILDPWWEERKASGNPVGQKYVACLGVVASMLANGVPPTRIAFALRHAPVVSTGALEMAIQQELQRRGERAAPERLTPRMQRLMGRPDGLRRFAEAAGHDVDDPANPLALPPGGDP